MGVEFRLCEKSISYLQSHLLEAAADFAAENDVICVLKDERTVTCIPGADAYLNLSGNAGMATAGSGDVLSGVIGGLLAQGMRAGVLHHLAYFCMERRGMPCGKDTALRTYGV